MQRTYTAIHAEKKRNKYMREMHDDKTKVRTVVTLIYIKTIECSISWEMIAVHFFVEYTYVQAYTQEHYFEIFSKTKVCKRL